MAGQLINAGGEQFVLVPLAEYERLAKAARALASSFEAPTPAAPYSPDAPKARVGESSLRTWRKHRGLSLEDAAKAVGVSKSFMSEVETGVAVGKPNLWLKLAKVLNTEIETILPQDAD